MAGDFRIRRLDGVWTVRSGGAILAETRNALELSEGDHDPVVYFPRADVAMEFLDRTDKVTQCHRKGAASYFTIVNRSARLENAVWSYETPTEAAAALAGHLAFYTGPDVTVERI